MKKRDLPEVHVEAWRKSGLSQAEYCRQRGVNPKTFSGWVKREPAAGGLAGLGLIPVRVAPAPVAAEEGPALVLRLAPGVRLDIPATVPARWVAELLRGLA
ncbi:hypothetical protein SAMN02949497_1952 [Methylomagnum ishizawai]|uniref:Transposase n=1 Tax=Methylomagnum ishizawai TaxID=1760988 RepID=A0A1Y6CTV0_9GAMM|nr:hypothetical protein [Methylomagnum ishizawai]SMF93717.1 hypothetical protein SAMN02949497_1004 [Methylomagnum ishizawai]SMF94630.1 hypothetical protein SAMN02949497_1952 [Methylomagnum ishizawai]